MNNENASTGPTTSSVAVRFYVVPIERGPDRRKWKAPTAKGWNLDENAIHYPQDLQPGQNGGICHKQSGTCAIDIDNLRTSTQWFDERGLNLTQLMVAGQQIRSGKENSGKLLYALPPDLVINAQWPHSVAMTAPDGTMVLEFRCMARTGKTVHDVYPGSLHPQSNQPYTWYSQQYGTNKPETLPIIPQALLDWWNEENAKRGPRSNQPPPEWSPIDDNPLERNKITKALRAIGPDCSYEQWLHVGMALHHTGWEDEAFEIWHDWSMEGSSYANTSWNQMMSKWEGFGYDRGINLDYMYHVAHTQDPNWNRPTQAEMIQQMSPDASVTIDHGTQQVEVDIRGLCERMDFGMSMAEMAPVFAAVASEPSNVMREQYIRIMSDRTHLPRPVLREQVNSLRQVQEVALPGTTIPWPDLSETDTPLGTLPNFSTMMRHYGYVPAYNTMTRVVECNRPAKRENEIIQDAKNLGTLTEMRSLCAKHGLNPQIAKEYRDYMAYCNHYHPFHQYLDASELEGGPYRADEADYIQLLCDSLQVSDDNKELRDKLVKTWLVSVVASAYMTWDLDRPPVRGVLVLQGPQRMGKSYWFEHLLPTGMVKSGASIVKNDMNHLKTATNRLVVELAEAEFNSRNLDMVAYLKSIVGRSVDELRKAYDAEEVQLLRRSVFCMTTNPGTFLIDDENSRYFTVPTEGIDRFIYNMIPMSRLWLQVKGLYDAGVSYLLDDTTSDVLQELNEQHRAKSRYEEWLLDTYHFDTMEGSDLEENWLSRTDLESNAGVCLDVSPGTALDILRRLTGMDKGHQQRTKAGKKRWWRIPARRNPHLV